MTTPPPVSARAGWVRRATYLALGCLMVALGVVGAVLPVMPSTVFLIAAAWCFARSSPRLEAWLYAHPRLGPGLRDWRDQGAISVRSKCLACAGMVLGYALFWYRVQPELWLAAGVAAFVLSGAVYVLTRPRPRREGPASSRAMSS